jgi:integrase
MPRRIRASNLETRTSRLKQQIAKKPIFVKVGEGIGLGYRRNRTAGTWVVRVADGRGGNWTEAIGAADDFEEANGVTVLDYWQAQDKARERAGMGRDDGSQKPVTVRGALDSYEADLKARGGDTGNVGRVRTNLAAQLLDKRVAALTSRELRKWRDSLAATLAPATVNRTCTGLKAALNLVASDAEQRIGNRQAWETGLATIPDAEESRNVILSEEVIRRLIDEAQKHSAEFGLLVDVAAVTGARISQLAHLKVQDLQADRSDPRLMMPTSKKGRGRKKLLQRPVPIPIDLAKRLAAAAADRGPTAPLLVTANGGPWRKSQHSRPFARIVKAAGLDPEEVTIYALRHSNVVRQLLAGVPVRIVAVNHDTSIVMIERTYSRHIGDHADALARAALLDTSTPMAGNVVPIRA